MKRTTVVMAALFSLALPMASFAAHDHGAMHGDMAEMGSPAHEEVIDGVKATFKVLNMKEHLKGQALPKGMTETHHIMVEFKEAKTGKSLTEGEVKMKVLGPDKGEQTKELMGMQGHFGADFNLSQKGKYGVMCKILLKDGKVRSSKFWYTVK